MPSGFGEMGSPYTGGQGLEGEPASPWSIPKPGTINFRINSFVNEFPMYSTWTGQNGAGTGTSNKQQGYGIYGWVRIDLVLDGMTKNGIKYGAFTEIRENNTTGIQGSNVATPQPGFATNTSAQSAGNTLYVRHANVYIGTDQLGFLRIGTGLGSQTLYETGLIDNFDIGGWISFQGANIPAQVSPEWPWSDEGSNYMAARIQYVSPTFAGFDFGASFAPNDSVPFDGSGCIGGTYTACATQSTSSLGADQAKFRNLVDVALRYRNTFGPVGLAVSGIYTTSGYVNAVGPQPYKGLNLGDVGASIQYNKVISVGGNVMFGAFNNEWGLQPVGGSSALAYVVGVKYTIPQIPMTLGTYYFNYRFNGLTTARPAGVGERTDQGLDVGAVYGMGPGVVLLAEYAWGQRHQTGYDFLTGATGSGSENTVTAQVFTMGMSVRF
jgi:hypothetical protein